MWWRCISSAFSSYLLIYCRMVNTFPVCSLRWHIKTTNCSIYLVLEGVLDEPVRAALCSFHPLQLYSSFLLHFALFLIASTAFAGYFPHVAGVREQTLLSLCTSMGYLIRLKACRAAKSFAGGWQKQPHCTSNHHSWAQPVRVRNLGFFFASGDLVFLVRIFLVQVTGDRNV